MSLAEKYIREEHPTIDELAAAQQLAFPRDPHDLLGDFWPPEESIEGFLAAMREWRGHAKTDRPHEAGCHRYRRPADGLPGRPRSR